jgi:YegS/Rv2252/BmrU family lipid kinase
MPASVAVIINPVAGGRSRGLTPVERVALVERALERHRLEGRVDLTAAAGHGRELARRAVEEGCAQVIAWGGDGTINEVASALAGTRVPLGIVRAGSGNGLARDLGIPKDPSRAIDVALTGRERPIDAGEIEGRWFFNLAGVGFDAAMAAEFNRLGTARRGPLRYTVSVTRFAFAYRPIEYSIEADGRRLDVSALVVAIANFRQYGSNTVIAPLARPDDGKLDVVVIEGRGALGRIGLIPRLFDRTIHKAPGVTVLQTGNVTIRAREPIEFHVDGEPSVGGTSVSARVHPAALIIKAP